MLQWLPVLQQPLLQQQQQRQQSAAVCVVGKAVNDSLSNSLLILVGVLGLVDDMLEGLACLVQVDFGLVNSRLHSTHRIGSVALYAELCTL